MVRYIVPRVIIILKISKLKKFQIADYSYPSPEISIDYDRKRMTHFGGDPNACPDNASHSPESRIRGEKEERGRGRRKKGGEIKTSLLSRHQDVPYYEPIV